MLDPTLLRAIKELSSTSDIARVVVMVVIMGVGMAVVIIVKLSSHHKEVTTVVITSTVIKLVGFVQRPVTS